MTAPALADLLRLANRRQLDAVHVALPGRVTEYDAETQKAKVQPLLRHRTRGGEFLSMPIINSVPVVWPRGGGALLSFPLGRDDGVLLIFSERSLDEWLRDGGEANPRDPRSHDLSDAIAIPGLLPFSDAGGADARDVLVKFGDAELRLTAEGAIALETRGGFVRLGADGTVALGGTQELLAVLSDFVDAVAAITTTNPQGLASLDPASVSRFQLIKAKLTSIKE